MRSFVAALAAVALYVVIGVFTKRFLTWTWGPVYFMFVLEVVPRTFGRLRGGRAVDTLTVEPTVDA
jgi:hypothetical protein